jgi:hypothetical protein
LCGEVTKEEEGVSWATFSILDLKGTAPRTKIRKRISRTQVVECRVLLQILVKSDCLIGQTIREVTEVKVKS